MESQVHVPTNETAWTDEMHVHFLNTMEASFVTAMFQNNYNPPRLLRLDRYLPDSSESTLDLKPHRTTNKHTPSGLMGRRARIEKRIIRRRSSHPYKSSQDQVVPQLENAREVGGGADAGEKKDQKRK